MTLPVMTYSYDYKVGVVIEFFSSISHFQNTSEHMNIYIRFSKHLKIFQQ